MTRQIFTSLAFLVALTSFSGIAQADHHKSVAGKIEAAVKQFYSQMSSHDYEAALGHIAIGGKGYVSKGELRSIDSEEVRKGIVQMLKAGQEEGAEMDLKPRDIKVAVHGSVAIATYMIDAKVKEPGEESAEDHLNRGTLVWSETDAGWKIVHWHISEFESEEG